MVRLLLMYSSRCKFYVKRDVLCQIHFLDKWLLPLALYLHCFEILVSFHGMKAGTCKGLCKVAETEVFFLETMRSTNLRSALKRVAIATHPPRHTSPFSCSFFILSSVQILPFRDQANSDHLPEKLYDIHGYCCLLQDKVLSCS